MDEVKTLLGIIQEQQRRITKLEEMLERKDSGVLELAALIAWFEDRSLKQKATALAYAQEVSVHELMKLLDCSESTIRLHLRSCRNKDIPSTHSVVSTIRQLTKSLSDEEFVSKFGIKKKWYLEPQPSLLERLRTKTSTLN